MSDKTTDNQNNRDNEYEDAPIVAKQEHPHTEKQTSSTPHRKHTWVEKFAVAFAALAFFASAWQGWVARDSEKRQLRAYVYAIPSVSNFAVGQSAIVQITLKNGGLTPAYNPSFAMGYEIAPDSVAKLPADIGNELPIPTFTPDGTGQFIYQEHILEETLPSIFGKPITQAQFNAVVVAKTSQIYIWGRVNYLDAFGHHWHTNYCFGLSGTNVNISSPEYTYCPNNNDAD